jgi:uncharacterized membrane protein
VWDQILVLLSFVPFVGFLFGLAGLVMVLLAVKRISEAVKDREIFHNVLMAVILQIVGSAISVFVVIGSFFVFVGSQVGMASFGSPFDGFGGPGILGTGAVMAVLGILLAGLVAMWIILIIAARFLRKGYERIADKTGTRTFRTVARWYYYGAWLMIILVGFVLILIARILLIKAFFYRSLHRHNRQYRFRQSDLEGAPSCDYRGLSQDGGGLERALDVYSSSLRRCDETIIRLMNSAKKRFH